jgi:hypothetical protein
MNNLNLEDFVEEGKQHPILGPEYFMARKIAENTLNNFKDKCFNEFLKETSEKLYEKFQETFESSLMFDAENNIQHQIWNTVEQIIRAILGGEQYILQKYVLGPKYDCGKIRETVAKLIPEELQNARIKDLESELKNVKDNLEFYQRRY